MGHINIPMENIDAFVFDFDGVLTNNLVHLDQFGREWVSCSRADGLAFDVLRKLNKPAFIISTEKNSVVAARAEKLKVPALQGVSNKVDALATLAEIHSFRHERIIFVGNDLNDLHVMQYCGYSACPSDSHPRIKQIATVTLNSCGGGGLVRELLESVMGLDFVEILYSK